MVQADHIMRGGPLPLPSRNPLLALRAASKRPAPKDPERHVKLPKAPSEVLNSMKPCNKGAMSYPLPDPKAISSVSGSGSSASDCSLSKPSIRHSNIKNSPFNERKCWDGNREPPYIRGPPRVQRHPRSPEDLACDQGGDAILFEKRNQRDQQDILSKSNNSRMGGSNLSGSALGASQPGANSISGNQIIVGSQIRRQSAGVHGQGGLESTISIPNVNVSPKRKKPEKYQRFPFERLGQTTEREYEVHHPLNKRLLNELFQACLVGDKRLVKAYCVSNRRYLHYTDNDGYTALHYAAIGGDPENYRNLLMAGSNPEILGKGRWTAAHAAAANEKAGILNLIYRECPQVLGIPDAKGWTTIDWIKLLQSSHSKK